jgi:hypothetical protein
MRKIVCFLLAIMVVVGVSAETTGRKKVAVVLSGGGAKGENNINLGYVF